MIIYSHRNSLDNYDKYFRKQLENRPNYIDMAIMKGFNVEADIRYNNSKFYLGHDDLQYNIDLLWLIDRRQHLLLHCKDNSSAAELSNCAYKLHYFCHHQDDFTLTSHGFVWQHNLSLPITKKSIIPLITKKDIDNWLKSNNINEIAGVCTDFPIYLKNVIVY